MKYTDSIDKEAEADTILLVCSSASKSFGIAHSRGILGVERSFGLFQSSSSSTDWMSLGMDMGIMNLAPRVKVDEG